MKRLVCFIIAMLLVPTLAVAGGWWDDWKDDDYYDRRDYYDDPYEEGYNEGYDEGYEDGSEDPFFFEDDKPGAFGYWFLQQDWAANEMYAWKSVFESLFDDIDRSGAMQSSHSVVDPAYVAIVSGKLYHADPNCAKLSNAYRAVELDVSIAKKSGFTACSYCVHSN